MFECDGCGLIGTLEEVETHILEQPTDDISNIRCWGAMEVGSVCWTNFHEHNIHPMTIILEQIRVAALETGINLEGELN